MRRSKHDVLSQNHQYPRRTYTSHMLDVEGSHSE